MTKLEHAAPVNQEPLYISKHCVRSGCACHYNTAVDGEPVAVYLEPVRTKDLTDDENRLKRIAAIAHCGGLANMSEDDALTAIRRITLPYFDREASDEETRAVIAADREKNK